MGALYDGVADNPPGGNDPSDPNRGGQNNDMTNEHRDQQDTHPKAVRVEIGGDHASLLLHNSSSASGPTRCVATV